MICLHNDPVARAQFNAQGLATMGLCPAWDRAVAAYVSADVRSKAQEEFGPLAQKRNSWTFEQSALVVRLGKDWICHPEGVEADKRRRAEEIAGEAAMMENFYQPLWEAVYSLALVPAPSLSAAVFKAAVIEIHEIWNDGAFKADCNALIDADFARHAGLAA